MGDPTNIDESVQDCCRPCDNCNTLYEPRLYETYGGILNNINAKVYVTSFGDTKESTIEIHNNIMSDLSALFDDHNIETSHKTYSTDWEGYSIEQKMSINNIDKNALKQRIAFYEHDFGSQNFEIKSHGTSFTMGVFAIMFLIGIFISLIALLYEGIS